jgi:hypothetical protein
MLRVLEVALGLALVFALVSFAISLVTEWISAIWGQRSALLRQAVEKASTCLAPPACDQEPDSLISTTLSPC